MMLQAEIHPAPATTEQPLTALLQAERSPLAEMESS
jgi:hypothetical protein